jgi:hypothetical protein
MFDSHMAAVPLQIIHAARGSGLQESACSGGGFRSEWIARQDSRAMLAYCVLFPVGTARLAESHEHEHEHEHEQVGYIPSLKSSLHAGRDRAAFRVCTTVP